MPSITDLLAKLVELRGPCPNICDGTTPLGGPTGTDTVSIITGEPVTPYPVIVGPKQIQQGLRLIFDDISNADVLVGDSSNVDDWNTFFDLPAYGNPFTSVEIDVNEVRLIGGSGITIKENTFISNTHILKVIDSAGCVTSIYTDSFSYCVNITEVSFPECLDITGGGYFDAGAFYGLTSLTSINFPKLIAIDNQCFADCNSLTSISLPSLTTAGSYSFYGCNSLTSISLPLLTSTSDFCFTSCILLTTIDLPSLTTAGPSCFSDCTSLININLPFCTNLGGTTGNNNVFSNIIGNTITLTVPASLATCDGGNPDGDIVHLDSNNTVTINYV